MTFQMLETTHRELLYTHTSLKSCHGACRYYYAPQCLEEKLNAPLQGCNEHAAMLKMILVDKSMGWKVGFKDMLNHSLGPKTIQPSIT